MKARPFRLAVEQIEERLTPTVTPTDVYAAITTIQTNTAVLQFITDSNLVSNAYTFPFVKNYLNYVNLTNTPAVATLNEFMNDLISSNLNNPFGSDYVAPTIVSVGQLLSEGQTGINYAQSFATELSVSLLPVPPAPLPPGTPPPPPNPAFAPGSGGATLDLTSDSGMVNTMPSIVGFTDLGDGVKIKDVITGSGTAASANSTVTVYYTGWLNANGTQFDARRSPANPAQFSLSGTIVGFREGVTGMQPGGIRQVFIPSALAYGNSGTTGIPPNSDLVFEVKLISTP